MYSPVDRAHYPTRGRVETLSSTRELAGLRPGVLIFQNNRGGKRALRARYERENGMRDVPNVEVRDRSAGE